jgi:hypothetical protein
MPPGKYGLRHGLGCTMSGSLSLMTDNSLQGSNLCVRRCGVLLAVLIAPGAYAQGGKAVAAGVSHSAVGWLFIAAAVVVLASLLMRSQPFHIGGRYRQWRAESRIRKTLRNCGKDVIHDFVLPGAYGGKSRIDHALLTKGGIICILARHYDGTIFGKPEDPQWLNVDGTVRRKFLNPMIQNESCVRALQKIVPGVPVRNLVVFTGDVHFSAEQDKNVIHLKQLNSAIAMFRFGPSQVEDWDASWLSVKSAALDNSTGAEQLASRAF